MKFPRRDFLRRCGRTVSAAVLAGKLKARADIDQGSAPAKIAGGTDEFVNEKYYDQIAAILARWSADLRGSPKTTENIRQDFSGLSKILTADFQVTRIQMTSGLLHTRVLYEIVGTGADFYREQRTGFWDLEWAPAAPDEWAVQNWSAHEEQRQRCLRPWFADITEHAIGANSAYGAQLIHGVDYWRTVLDGACGIDIYGHNGVSVGDIDNDGFDDLYICQPAGLPNRLFRNRGDGTFEDITERSGTGLLDNTACALFADFNNDGRQDLVVVRSNGPLLFLNKGDGRFRCHPDAFQFVSTPKGTFTGAAAGDYNRDGLLDIYFCLYIYYQGTDEYNYPAPYYDANNGPPNFLMRNNGDGTFRDVTAESGLNQNNTRYSFCCGWCDYNGVGWPDLYVVNDFGRKNLYRNNGDGTFTDVAPELGVEDVGAGMGVCWFDYNNDGAEDLYVANMWTAAGERISSQDVFKKDSPETVRALYRKHAMGNSLFENRPHQAFRDVTNQARAGRGRWAWSSDAWDYDHDGFTDLYVVNGMVSGSLHADLNSLFWRRVVARSRDDRKPSSTYEEGWNTINDLLRCDYSWSGYERNVLFHNNRDGSFSDVAGAVGPDFLEDGRAFALSDFDHDGRQELFLKNRNAPQLRILKNIKDSLPPAIAVCLRGTKSNRDAIGAAVTVETESLRQTKSLQAGSGFLSQHSKELFFGLGQDRGPVRISVRWPSGLVQHFGDVPPGHRIHLVEAQNQPLLEPFATASVPRSTEQRQEILPERVETWLLAPIPAPKRQKNGLLTFDNAADAGVYNVIYRYAFERHRDITQPTSFLISEGEIVKICQGAVDANTVNEDLRRVPKTRAEQLQRALPFAGVADTFEFGRNYLALGSVYFRSGYMDEAEGSFQLALRDDPASAEANYGLGSVYLTQEKLEQARGRFEQAVKGKASYPDTPAKSWNNLGLIAARHGRAQEGIDYFQKALQLSPDYVVALENLGNAYRELRQWDKALEVFERGLSLSPDNAELHYSLGMVFAQTDQPDRAHEHLEKAVKLRPDYPEALNNLGVLYIRTRRIDQAIATFTRCAEVAPGFDQAYLNLARVYELQGETAKARTVLTRLLRQQPGNQQAQKALAELR